MHTNPRCPTLTTPQACSPASASIPSDTIQADQLFNGRQEIQIGHNGDIYRLRITKNDKLILTK